MDFIRELVNKEAFKRITFFAVLIVILYFIKPLLNLVLLTFIFAFLINSVETFIVSKLSKYIKVREGIVTLILYMLVVALIVVAFYKYIPIIIKEGQNLLTQAEDFYKSSDAFSNNKIINEYISPMIEKINIENYTKDGAKYLLQFASNVGVMSLHAFMALILSLFFMLEKHDVIKFGKRFEHSKLSGMYKYFVHFGNNFLNSFGKVIKAQIIIATVNTTLSVIGLAVMGFPNIMTLGVMIFVLSLIPVAGVIISLIPLGLIAFKINGFIEVFYVLIMVVLIHCVETYFLNPKLMSSKTKIPIFFTFVILLFSEEFMHTWGLLLGIPLFMFILDIFEVKLEDDVNPQVEDKK